MVRLKLKVDTGKINLMKKRKLTRRDFLKLSGLSLGGLALYPAGSTGGDQRFPADALGLVRVAVKHIDIYKLPDYKSEVTGSRGRDELLYIYDKIDSPMGPAHNPRWYQIEEGYVHSAYLQPVETRLNEILYSLPRERQLAEVTVPLTLSWRYTDFYGWQPLYRLYYQSVHWVTGAGWGPNQQPWYQITDDLLKLPYHVPAQHLRFIAPEEITPLSQDIPAHKKHIIVDRREQTLTATEDKDVVLHTKISTGLPYGEPENGIATITPLGDFNVQVKLPVRHMGNGNLTSDIEAYELPGVPWVSFFHKTGVGFHGTFWHDNYGREMSHGCVNMKPDEAKWLWRWVTPVSNHIDWSIIGRGTSILVTV